MHWFGGLGASLSNGATIADVSVGQPSLVAGLLNCLAKCDGVKNGHAQLWLRLRA